MRPLLSPEEMSELDKKSMQAFELSSWELMNHVADEMALALQREIKDLRNSDLLVLCGPGNNGGDGYCLAEKIRPYCKRVFVEALYSPCSEDCVRASKECKASVYNNEKLIKPVVVDAMFGCFGKDKLEPKVKNKFRYWNKRKATRVSLDVPSGIDTKAHRVHSDSFMADLTLCVAYPKDCFWKEEVLERCGKIVYVGNKFLELKSSKMWALEGDEFYAPLRKRTGHKSGRCLVVAGSSESPGAAFLTSEAAARVGAGYVQLLWAQRIEKLKIELKNSSFQHAKTASAKLLNSATALVMGPGGAPSKPAAYLRMSCPQVIDADALKFFSTTKKLPKGDRILTPHPGEASKILKSELSELNQNRSEALAELVERTGQSVYLKGAPGLLQFSDSSYSYVNLYSAPNLSTAGSGDVLSGILGGFLARSDLSFYEACLSGLSFQRKLASLMPDSEACLSSDQLGFFDQALKDLRNVDNSKN